MRGPELESPQMFGRVGDLLKVCIAALVSAGLLLATARPSRAQTGQTYSGAASCAKCHSSANRDWASSRHSKMIQPATPQSVIGDFSARKVVLRGSTYSLRQSNGNYYITESYFRGTPWEHRVDYTLGSRRIQHYLTTLPNGRIVLIPATWDNVRRRWIHNVDIADPEEAPGVQVQVWNKFCYSCHVSREEKNFDLQAAKYTTIWQDFGTNCERCHGPGGEHIAWANSGALDADTLKAVRETIANPARMTSERSTMVCAQCHSFRDIYVDGFRAGTNYYDYFLPALEYIQPNSKDPAYWADGRTRRFSNDAMGLWESQCYLKGGATCLTCHATPHNTNIDVNPQLKATNNGLCTQCHQAIGADLTAHTHHGASSAGSSCVECHMPTTVVSILAKIRDHSMSIPVPENTIRHGIPNACNLCHSDKKPEWALSQMKSWYGDASRQKLILRADAFTAARAGNPAAIHSLLQILSDPSGGPLIRANAVGYLANFPREASAYSAVQQAFSDSDPLVRATAAIAFRPVASDRRTVAPALVQMLNDPVAIVRVNAGVALAEMGLQKLPGEDGERYERVKEIYRARAALGNDDAEQQLAAGKFFYLSGDLQSAVSTFRASVKLDPAAHAQIYLARALAEQGDVQSAREILKTISRVDPQYAAAQKMLALLN